MANVILTNTCNLSCPYCFAGEIRALAAEYITQEALTCAVTFLKKSCCDEIGLIGGEPTLHPHFVEILSAMADTFNKVFVYSNGICLEKFFPDALKENICYLINVNETSFIGEVKFKSICHMLESAATLGKIRQFSLSVNIYRENQTFDDVLLLCENFGLKGLRISVVVPAEYGLTSNEWFTRLKPSLMHLYRMLKDRNIVPKYDCNIVPPCIFTPEELEFLRTLPGSPSDIARLTGDMCVCRPVIDIYPDLTVARCFGISEKRHRLSEFVSLSDAIRCFMYEIDGAKLYAEKSQSCQECYRRRTLQCYGGCLKFLGE